MCVDVFGNVSKIILRDRRNTFASLSDDVLHFSWPADVSSFILRNISDESCCVRSANRIVIGLREVVTKCKFHGRRCIL